MSDELVKLDQLYLKVMETRMYKMAINQLYDDDGHKIPFDVFEFNIFSHGKPLSLLLYILFDHLNFFNTYDLDLDKFKHFILQLENGYYQIPYHNKLHAADVTHAYYTFVTEMQSHDSLLLPIDLFSGILAAAMHDFAHPGTNNVYHINSSSDLAICYNDQSILESYHCSQAFYLLNKIDNNFYDSNDLEFKKEVREIIISLILATDMKGHFKLVNSLKAYAIKYANQSGSNANSANSSTSNSAGPNTPSPNVAGGGPNTPNVAGGPNTPTEEDIFQDRLLLMNNIIHAADISNPTKKINEFIKWTDMLFKELFKQGDKERIKNLPISNLCDRHVTNIPQSQIGFCKFIALPMFETLSLLDMKTFDYYVKNIKVNIEYWIQQDKKRNSRGFSSRG